MLVLKISQLIFIFKVYTSYMPTNIATIKSKSLKHIFYPCAQMKDYESQFLLEIIRAEGPYLYLKSGQKIIDGIASWWCKSLGHQHPRLKQALKDQLEKFEHVIMANTTHENLIELSQRLGNLCPDLYPDLNKIFYASDGACAVEIALKLSLHSRKIMGENKKIGVIALSNGYHGETIGALSVSDLGRFKKPYQDFLFTSYMIKNLPYVLNQQDPVWDNCEDYWEKILPELEKIKDQTTAIIFEPIVQGSAGMRIISADFFTRLNQFAKTHGIHLIADEIMTGLGRTGKLLACEYAHIQPDFVCLSKSLTAGFLPMSAVIMTNQIYDIFYDHDLSHSAEKSFLHSHTYSGNALAVGVALENLKIIQEENICLKARNLQIKMQESFKHISDQTACLKNIRGIGGIIAADLNIQKLGPEFLKHFFNRGIQAGILLRPLGETLYWFPPLNISEETLGEMEQAMLALLSVC